MTCEYTKIRRERESSRERARTHTQSRENEREIASRFEPSSVSLGKDTCKQQDLQRETGHGLARAASMRRLADLIEIYSSGGFPVRTGGKVGRRGIAEAQLLMYRANHFRALLHVPLRSLE